MCLKIMEIRPSGSPVNVVSPILVPSEEVKWGKYMSDMRFRNGTCVRPTPFPIGNGASPVRAQFCYALSLVEQLVEVIEHGC